MILDHILTWDRSSSKLGSQRFDVPIMSIAKIVWRTEAKCYAELVLSTKNFSPICAGDDSTEDFFWKVVRRRIKMAEIL